MKLVYYGDPILRQPATKITDFTKQLRTTSDRMKQLMHHHKGRGLAAPQVGLGMRLIVFGFPPNSMCNPRVVEIPRDVMDWKEREGCLSLPGVRVNVTRPWAVVVEFEELRGNTRRVQFSGSDARVLQHEIDHINGKLILEHLNVAGKLAYRNQLKRIQEALW